MILSAGMKPRNEMARRSGVDLGQYGGIKVNARMETNYPEVYACGDCAEVVFSRTDESILSLLWFSAKQQGKIAGFNSAGMTREYSAPMNVISLKLFDTYVASISHPSYSTDQTYEEWRGDSAISTAGYSWIMAL